MDEIKEQLNRIERYALLGAKNVLSLDDVHLLTGLSKSHIYRMTSRNEIPYYKRGRILSFDKKEVEAWMKQNRHNTVEEADRQAFAYDMGNL